MVSEVVFMVGVLIYLLALILILDVLVLDGPW
jgi:hypothetical protein